MYKNVNFQILWEKYKHCHLKSNFSLVLKMFIQFTSTKKLPPRKAFLQVVMHKGFDYSSFVMMGILETA